VKPLRDVVLYRVGMICSPGTCHGYRREGIVKLLGLMSLPGVASESMGMPARQPNGPSIAWAGSTHSGEMGGGHHEYM
jgi:hypothetical protein